MSGEVRPPSDSQNAPEEVPKTPPESKEPKRLDTTDLNKEFSNPENKGTGAPQEKATAENSERPGEDQGSISKSETSQPNRLDSSDLQSEFSTPESRGEVASQENKGLERRDTSGEEGGNAGKAETKDPNRLDTADLSREFTPPKTSAEVSSQGSSNKPEMVERFGGESGTHQTKEVPNPSPLTQADSSKEFPSQTANGNADHHESKGADTGGRTRNEPKEETLKQNSGNGVNDEEKYNPKPEAENGTTKDGSQSEYRDPTEGVDFVYKKFDDDNTIAACNISTGEIFLNENLRKEPPEVRIPHYEHEKVHRDGGDPRNTFDEEKRARIAQDKAWQALKKPDQKDIDNDANHKCLYDENGTQRDDGAIKRKLEAYGYDFKQ